jgi:hypothetical protein
MAVAPAGLPAAHVHDRGGDEAQRSLAVAQAAQHLALVHRSAAPPVHPCAADGVLLHGALVADAVRPGHAAVAMHVAVRPAALVDLTAGEHGMALAMQLPVLTALPCVLRQRGLPHAQEV